MPDERKLVTVVFADVAGFTALAETLDAEAVRDLLNGLFDRLVPCVVDNGGVVDKFIGDSLMAVFGAPVTHDDDPARAIRCAMQMRRALDSYNADLPVELSIHVGVNSGRVVAGPLGGGGKTEYTVIGDAVNVAKRLEEASGPGEIVVGPLTHRLAADSFTFVAAGTVQVRGRAGPVAAYRVAGERRGRAAGRGGLRPRAALVGRADELRVFETALDRLSQGEGGALFVVGDAGLGKSRLVAEARRRGASLCMGWREGRAVSSGRSASFLPFREHLKADVGIDPDDDPVVRLAKLRRRADRLLGKGSDVALPFLAQLMSLPLPVAEPSRPASATDEATWQSAVDALGGYLVAAARECPLVLVFEDVHWLDVSSARMLEHLLPTACAEPLLFCVVSRDDPDSCVRRLLHTAARCLEDRCVELALSPLRPGVTEELVHALLGGAHLAAGLELAIRRRAEGNPFFVEEIVRHLIDVGALHPRASGEWAPTAIVSDAAIPYTLQGTLTARIDLLPEGPKRRLRQASVIGRAFDRRLLEALDDDGRELDASLAALEERGLIERGAASAPRAFVFKHALVQEAAYDSLLLKERRDLHGRVAAAIEQVFAENPLEQYAALAFHSTRAEDWERAQEFLVKAGEWSLGVSGDAEGLAYYREAMSALLRTFDDGWSAPDGDDPVEWFVRRVEPFREARQLGELLDAIETFHQRVVGACGPADARTFAAASLLGAALVHRGLYAQAQMCLEEALAGRAAAGAATDRPAVRALLTLGVAHLCQDHFSVAEEVLEAALGSERAATQPDAGVLGEACVFLSAARYYAGHLAECRAVIEEALASPDIVRGPRYWELALNLCSCQLLQGEWSDAGLLAERCVSETSSAYLRAIAQNHLAAVRHAQGDYPAAEVHFLDALRAFDELGRSAEIAEGVRDLAETLLQMGRLDEAEEAGTRALGLIESTCGEGSWHAARAHWTLAGVELAKARTDSALRLLDQSEAIAAAKVAAGDPFWAELLFRRAQARFRQGRIGDAVQDLEGAKATLRVLGGEGHPRLGTMSSEWAPLAAGLRKE